MTDRALYVRGRALLRAGRHEMAKCDLLQVVASSRLEQHGVDRQRAEELLVDARRSRGGLAGALAQPPLDVGRELLAAAADEFRQCKYVLCAEVCSQCEVVVAGGQLPRSRLLAPGAPGLAATCTLLCMASLPCCCTYRTTASNPHPFALPALFRLDGQC